MISFSFTPTPPFDFDLSAQAAGSYWAFGHTARRGGRITYRRLLRVSGALALVELSSTGTPDKPSIEAHLLAASGQVDPLELERQIAWIIDPHFNLLPFYAMAQGEVGLRDTVDLLHGLRFLRMTSVFESLIVTIIEQQISLKSAQRAERWLVETYGEAFTYQGERYGVLPSPQRLAALSVNDLTPLKITFIRMERMLDIARRQASGELDLEALAGQPAERLYHALVKLRGVGHWTAAWTINRALGQFTYLGAADVALQAAVNRYMNGKTGRMDGRAMDAHFARYGEFAGLAAFYILTRWEFDNEAYHSIVLVDPP